MSKKKKFRPDQATAALHDIEINGEDHEIGRLDLNDFGDLNQHMRSLLLRAARMSFFEGDPEDDKRLVIEVAMKEAANVDFLSGRNTQLLNDITTLRQILYMGLRKADAATSVRDVGAMFTMDRTGELERVSMEILKISGLSVEKDEKDDEGGKDDQRPDFRHGEDLPISESGVRMDAEPDRKVVV